MSVIKIDNPGNPNNKNNGYGSVTYTPLPDDKTNNNVPNEKKEIPPAKPVVKPGAVVSTKTPIGKKLGEAFELADGSEIKRHFLKDVLVPGLKRGTLEVLDFIFFRGSGPSYGNYNGGGYTNYGSMYNHGVYSYTTYPTMPTNNQQSPSQPIVNSKVDYRNIILRSFPEAQDLVKSMRERIQAFGYCSIADMFRMLQISCDYPDLNWGWTRPESIDIRRASNGFLIYVTEAEYLGN